MNKGAYLFLFLMYAYYLYVPTKQAMHMYQQNRYNNQRYWTWFALHVKDRYVTILKGFLSLATCYGLLFVSSDYMPIMLLAMLVCVYAYISYKLEEHKKYRKPFVVTKRIKRLWIGFYLGYVLLFFCMYCFDSIHIWILITPFFYYFPWCFLLFIANCLYPIETAIKMHYVHDAKAMLEAYRDNLSIVGITGSYGKTSVKMILSALLSDMYDTIITPQSYNNQMGITLTIRKQLTSLHEIFLCEMGADHVGEIQDLMDFVKPQYGIVSAVGPQHLQTFTSMDAILHEKMQMIEMLGKDGIGFINADNEYMQGYTIQNTCRIIRFGIHQKADYQAIDMKYSAQGSSFTILHKNRTYRFHTHLLGEHNVANITCAIAFAHTFHVPWAMLQQAVKRLAYVEHRLEVKKTATYTIIDDAYNANPQGAKCALDVIQQMPHKRFIVTPGFIDLGSQQEQEQYQFGKQIATCCDEVVLVGRKQTISIMRGLDDAAFSLEHVHIVDSIQEAFSFLNKNATNKDIVLLENDLPDAFHH